MKENRDCRVIQDLLPNYIEKLTSEETNKYIEEHLGKCDECKNIFENMKKEFDLNNISRDKREVKYIKKFSNKMRLLKVIIIIIILILLLLTGRKIFIISKLSNNAEETITSTNYHRISYSYEKDNYKKTEVFNLEDRKKIITTQITDEERITRTIFAKKISEKEGYSEYLTNIYTETEDSKTAELNKNMSISVELQNTLYVENMWQLFWASIPAKITTTTFDGNECYYISNFESPYSYCSEGMYINKETGLIISTIAYELEDSDGTQGRWPAAEYVYEFNTVSETDFIEPNIDEYELKN